MAAKGLTVNTSSFIEGLDLDMAKLQRQTLPRAMARVGITMQDVAQGIVPVDTGHLKASITHRETVKGLTYRTEVGTNVEYAPYVEFGTGDAGQWSMGNFYMGHDAGVTYTAGWPGVRARPFLRPAVYDLEAAYVEMVREAFKQAVKA